MRAEAAPALAWESTGGVRVVRSGLQVLLVGGGSAAIGYLIGVLVPELF